MIILPITFYITSHDKEETLEFIGFKKRNTKHNKNASHNTSEKTGNTGENRKRERDRERDRDENENEDETDETDKRKYEMLKRLQNKKSK